VRADISIHKDAHRAGVAVTFTMKASNAGPNPAQGVTIRDILSDKLAYVSASTTKGTCSWTPSTRTLVCSAGSLARTESFTVTLLTSENVNKGKVSNTATVSASTADPNTGNNSSTAQVDLR
jgi:uncharacterized repeat protein (TIGR01451 family)